MRYQGAFGSLTDVGKVRISNEDQAFAASNNLGEVMLLVCDGMGRTRATAPRSSPATSSTIPSKRSAKSPDSYCLSTSPTC